ncbi:hypothetical protein [Natronoarchaeum rubrum]|uniref:hypothetical protein n=1 Tax=Natronoarchaeum rubrum TaxID=755311 RepID=UPI0021115297|nr:hypothetical protein [Natronoarchaeum rubrum]
MRRRSFVVGLGGVATSLGLAAGSGAFTSVEADRTVNVDVEEDYDAVLKLEEVGAGERSEIDGGTVEFELPGDDDGDYAGTTPTGLGTDSTYRFAGDAADSEGGGLFTVTNHGTQPVAVYGAQTVQNDVPSVSVFDVESGAVLTESAPSESIGVGESLACGLEVDTHGVDVRNDEYQVALTIGAAATV